MEQLIQELIDVQKELLEAQKTYNRMYFVKNFIDEGKRSDNGCGILADGVDPTEAGGVASYIWGMLEG